MFEIKDKFKKNVVGFNGSTAPLGERADLHILAEIAVGSGQNSLLMLFKKKPTLESISKSKSEKLISELK